MGEWRRGPTGHVFVLVDIYRGGLLVLQVLSVCAIVAYKGLECCMHFFPLYLPDDANFTVRRDTLARLGKIDNIRVLVQLLRFHLLILFVHCAYRVWRSLVGVQVLHVTSWWASEAPPWAICGV